MTDAPDLSVVVPVYNAAPRVRPMSDAVSDFARRNGLGAELVFIDDHSADRSWDEICALRPTMSACVRGARLAENVGQQAATYCGILESRGRWVVTIDDDLDPHPREISRLLAAAATGADLVYGVRAPRESPALRAFGRTAFRALQRWSRPRAFEESSFRLIAGPLARSLPPPIRGACWVDPPLVESAAHVASIAVEGSREARTSRYSLGALLGLGCARLLAESRLAPRIRALHHDGPPFVIEARTER